MPLNEQTRTLVDEGLKEQAPSKTDGPPRSSTADSARKPSPGPRLTSILQWLSIQTSSWYHAAKPPEQRRCPSPPPRPIPAPIESAVVAFTKDDYRQVRIRYRTPTQLGLTFPQKLIQTPILTQNPDQFLGEGHEQADKIQHSIRQTVSRTGVSPEGWFSVSG